MSQVAHNSFRSEKEQMFALIAAFREETGTTGPVRMPDVAAWILRNRDWQAPFRSRLSDLTRRLSRAAKAKHHTDAQGRRVRTMHAATYTKMTAGGQLVMETIWDQLETMSAEHARVSFGQRLDKLGDGARSLKRDEGSFVDNNPNAKDYVSQLSFNFEAMLEERSEPQVDTIEDRSPGKPKKPR